VPRSPKGKRIPSESGAFVVASKNHNGAGSVYFEPPAKRTSGTTTVGRWRATYLDAAGKLRRVTAPTRALVEQRRADALKAVERSRLTASRFSRATTVEQLLSWWLETGARHQVKVSTLDSYRKFARYLCADLGSMPVVAVGPETLTVWQSDLLDRYAPFTVLNCRKVCRQAFTEAVKVGLIAANPFDLVKPPPARRVNEGRALSPDEARRLIGAAEGFRWGTAVVLLFCQGWRVSEVLGLAWEDVDLEAATARVRRGASYTSSAGVVLGSTKTSGTEGVHHLAPISVDHLRRRREEQGAERTDDWPVHLHGGHVVHPVFTQPDGSLVTRQAIAKVVERAAVRAGLDPAGLATHSGRRTVITALYADGRVDLADVARHVGHANTQTTASYVRSLGKRPEETARRAAELLDPTMA
jgi:integrase